MCCKPGNICNLFSCRSSRGRKTATRRMKTAISSSGLKKGDGQIVIDGKMHPIKSDDAILAPAGARHSLINTGAHALKLYTLYGPPNHLDQLIRKSKSEASVSKEKFAGAATD